MKETAFTHVKIRLPQSLREKLLKECKESRRSLNSEVLMRLEQSFAFGVNRETLSKSLKPRCSMKSLQARLTKVEMKLKEMKCE